MTKQKQSEASGIYNRREPGTWEVRGDRGMGWEEQSTRGHQKSVTPGLRAVSGLSRHPIFLHE